MMHDLVLVTLNWLFKNLGRHSCLAPMQTRSGRPAYGRPTGLSLARASPPFHWRCDLTLVIAPGCWITDLDTSSHWVVGPLILVQAFRSVRSNRHSIHDSEVFWVCHFAPVSKMLHYFQGCQAGWPRWGRSAWVCAQIRPLLVHVDLKSQLIQNLWNSL